MKLLLAFSLAVLCDFSLVNSNRIEVQTPAKLKYQFFPVSGACATFKVRAPRNVHVCLAAKAQEADPMTQISIGGWYNRLSVIRKNHQQPSVYVPTPEALNNSEDRGFWIRWYPGVVTVGREGEAAAFLSLADPNLHPINFMGISTGNGASGSWIIDTDGNDGDCQESSHLNTRQTDPPRWPTRQTVKATISPVMTNSEKEIETPNKFQYQFFPVSGACVAFKVRTSSAVHLCLTGGPQAADSMIEIIIGGEDNTQSFIRKHDQQLSRVATPGILDASEFRGFWVRWYHGVVLVGREGDATAFMSLADRYLQTIHFLGISTDGGHSGLWNIDRDSDDCQASSILQRDPAGWTTPQIERVTDSPVMTNNTKEIQTPDKSQYQFFPVSGACVTFKVRASNDVHLCLTAKPKEADPMIEIIIGGQANNESVIRKNRQTPDAGIVPTPGILYAGQFRGFWVRWYHGVVIVGRQGETTAFMSLADPHLHRIRFMGISTGDGASGSWIIDTDGGGGDCQAVSYDPQINPDGWTTAQTGGERPPHAV